MISSFTVSTTSWRGHTKSEFGPSISERSGATSPSAASGYTRTAEPKKSET